MVVLDLNTVSDKKQLIEWIVEENRDALSTASIQSIASTVLTFMELQNLSKDTASLSSFDTKHLLFLPATDGHAVSNETRKYLGDLTIYAENTAEFMGYSSILAGPGSESDDTGDVAFWLGSGDHFKNNANAVLSRLGLGRWSSAGNISDVEMTSRSGQFLPVGLEWNNPRIELLTGQMARLQDSYCFRVQAPMTGAIVLFVLTGRIMDDLGACGGWGGLVGFGTWSDL
ncbi:hypothetical protein AX17_005791 [Amanita inopinata Kibby_2008]|nr:hypothetical protein AX17_005791 [Amanita inopinata Kibby_2008]